MLRGEMSLEYVFFKLIDALLLLYLRPAAIPLLGSKFSICWVESFKIGSLGVCLWSKVPMISLLVTVSSYSVSFFSKSERILSIEITPE